MIYDAVIVGGGPAGAIAAWTLAAAGARVAMLEKERYPRPKVCAGGVTPRARALLAPVLGSRWESAVAAEVKSLVAWTQSRFPQRHELQRPFWHTVSRETLDSLLADSAAEKGAELLTGWRVREVTLERESGLFRINSQRGNLLAGSVIGADGARGVVARSLGIGPRLRMAPAMEVEVALRAGDRRFESEAWLDFGVVPMGYAWVFPKGGQVSVGIGGLTNGKRLAVALRAFAGRNSLDLGETRPRGWVLPVWRPGVPASRGNALLVGDAAGLVDPITGEGLYYAVRSGELAATALLASGFGPRAESVYETSLTYTFRRDLFWGYLLARVIGASSRRAKHWLSFSPGTFGWLVEAAEGRTSYRELPKRIISQLRRTHC